MRTRAGTFLGIALGSLALGSLVCYIFFNFSGLAARANNLVYDYLLTHTPREAPGGRVAIIDIDDASLEKYGQLPWPRSILADLVTIALSAGASAIALDIWMTEPDRSSPVAVDSLLEKNFGLNLDLSAIPPLAQDNDRYLRMVIDGKPVALGAFAGSVNQDQQASELPPAAIVKTPEGKERLKNFIKKADGLIPPLPLFSSAALTGVLNLSPDEDGVVRSLPALTRVADDIYPALSLRALMIGLGESEIELDGSENGLSALKIGRLIIPVDKDGSLGLVYHGPRRTMPFYSAADVLEGKVGREELDEKIVFIGPSAYTQINLSSTPFDPETPTSEVLATATDNILSESSIRVPSWGGAAIIAATYAASLCGVAAFSLLTLPIYAAIMLLLIAAMAGAAWLLFLNGLFVSPAAPILAVILAGGAIVPCRYWLEQKRRRKLQLAFGHYVSPEIVTKIVAAGDQLLLGEQKQVTVLFSDVRNFTTISEKLEPRQLVELLNKYFTPMTACVISQKGTLDKFIGDALMAFWNAPLDVASHSAKAVLAALEMQKALAAMRTGIKKEFGVELHMGLGLSAGVAHVGNMGSNDLMNYTCIGETVNLASRLEGLCKIYGVGIIASASVKDACPPDFDFLELDNVIVKGLARPIRIYTIPDAADDLDSEAREAWESALDAYRAGDFAAAKAGFESASACSFMKTASELFIKRCVSLKSVGKENWSGVWKYTEK